MGGRKRALPSAGLVMVLVATGLLLAPAYSQAEFDVPCTDPRGCPDLVLDQKKLEKTKLVTETFLADDCSVQEGQVGGTGTRRLVIFPYSTPNLGPGSLIIGDPLDPANTELFEWGACHGHYHYQKYAAYRLWRPADFARFQQLRAENPTMLSGQIITAFRLNPVVGTKRGFCIVDVDHAKEFQGTRDAQTYTQCGHGTTIHGYQGISVGWADTYGRRLQGQWIDVTNVPDGDYVLDVETNPERSFQEARYDNNSAHTSVTVTH
jgi:lysyl oxidase